MRRFIAFSLTLSLAACAPRPQQTPAPPVTAPAPPQEAGSLVGLTPQELVERFGRPALQVHEGSSLKLQFRGSRCVLDAYLYPSGTASTLKVTHVDTRLRSGADIDQTACVTWLRQEAS
jgi:hypothetical protein